MISSSNKVFLLGAAVLLTLSACAGKPIEEVTKDGQFWQRVSTSSAIYMRGPKAQQMLNRDIARCVTELRELERLGQLKRAIPVDKNQRVLDPDQLALEGYETPERNGYLLMEQSEYNDFETCMLDKGWERVEHVPYDISEEARENYIRAHVEYEYQTRRRPAQPPVQNQKEGPYQDLNE